MKAGDLLSRNRVIVIVITKRITPHISTTRVCEREGRERERERERERRGRGRKRVREQRAPLFVTQRLLLIFAQGLGPGSPLGPLSAILDLCNGNFAANFTFFAQGLGDPW